MFNNTEKELIENGEIQVSGDRVLRHILRPTEDLSASMQVKVRPTTGDAPVFQGSFYLANIGTPQEPTLLDLRFEPTPDFYIALLMTNERRQRDLEVMGRELLRRVLDRGIEFDGIIAPDSLGSRLSQEIARLHDPNMPITSLQKGKPHPTPNGLRIGSPKPWIDEEAGVELTSGTSHAGVVQRFFLDQRIAGVFKNLQRGVLFVDDARLSEGTIVGGLQLLDRMKIPVAGIATVLNEAAPTMDIQGIPYESLTKLPVFDQVEGGFRPIPGSYDGLDNFYIES